MPHNQSKRNSKPPIIQVTRAHIRYAALTGAFLCAAVLFFLFGVLFRVLMGPVSLGPLNGQLRSALHNVLPGLELRFDDAALEWSRDEGRVNLVILGTRVFDRDGRIIAQAPQAEIGLAAGPFLLGEIVVRRIALVGVQLTLVHTSTGALRLGVERDNSRSDILQQLRDAIEKRQAGSSSSLKSFAVHKARLAFFDEETGAFVVAPEAELQISDPRDASARAQGVIAATVDAQIEISGRRAHVFANVNFPGKGEAVTGDISISGLSLTALASNTKTFRFFAPFDLSSDVSGSFVLEHGTTLKFADFGIDAGGVVNGLGKPFRVKSLRIVGRYDGASGRLLIDDGTLASAQLRAHLDGSADLAFDRSGMLDHAGFDLAVDKMAVNMPGILSQAVTLTRAAIRGTYVPAGEQIAIDQALIFGGPLAASLSGKITLGSDESPAIAVDGKVNAIGVRDLLKYWPLTVADGARDWIDTNVSAGRIGPVLLHAAIAAGVLDKSALPDDALTVTFPVEGATITYLRSLSPLTNVVGTGTLRGDAFKADVASATVGRLAVSDGHVVIPDLHEHGAAGDIGAHVAGALSDVLALVDMKPLQYPTRFHVNTQGAKGDASLDLAFHVPMFKNVSVEKIGISIKATVDGIALSLGPHTKISGGTVAFDIDNNKLHAVGPIQLEGADLSLDWLETFKTSPITTRLAVRGTLDDAERSALGLHVEDVLSGPVGIDADLRGFRGKIQRAQIGLDLTPTTVGVDLVNIHKAAGIPASGQISARLDAGGNVQSAAIAISGANLAVRGNAVMSAGGDIQHLDLPVIHAGAANDFSLTLNESSSAGLDAVIMGHSLDGTALGHRDSEASSGARSASNESSEPFHVSAHLDRMVLRDSMILTPFALDVSGAGRRPRTLSLNGALSKSAAVSATMTNGEGGRHLTLTTGDAGLLFRGLLGFDSIKGGQFTLNATLPPIAASARGEPDRSPVSGEVVIRDFTVVNQAFLTRLFSAGSFGGFIDLMRGQGIAVDTFEVPFRINGDVIDIHDARASGPSIGITADGYIDRAANKIALQGAMAPLFGINGVLGAIPVLGTVFVSKKGEGLFGVTYSVTGDADQPQITMNPLAILAPGIFRRIFQGATPSEPPPQANKNPEPSPQKVQ